MATADEIKGRAKEAAGDLTDNDSLKSEGKIDRAKGEVKDAVDKVADRVGEGPTSWTIARVSRGRPRRSCRPSTTPNSPGRPNLHRCPATRCTTPPPDEDSARWLGFPFREGDIVISTRSKSGTTWVQMICALLVFQTPGPARRARTTCSPWLDWLIRPRADVFAQLAAQPHRRFIKAHTPLDGLPADPRVTYIVTGRHPLDMAVSLYHQSDNLDREQWVGCSATPLPHRPRPTDRLCTSGSSGGSPPIPTPGRPSIPSPG